LLLQLFDCRFALYLLSGWNLDGILGLLFQTLYGKKRENGHCRQFSCLFRFDYDSDKPCDDLSVTLYRAEYLHPAFDSDFNAFNAVTGRDA
jgi:hypothetical protein